MRQDKKKQQGFIGALLHISMTCLPKCCHGPANHDAVVLASKVIIKTRSSIQPPCLSKVLPFPCDSTEVTLSVVALLQADQKTMERDLFYASAIPKVLSTP